MQAHASENGECWITSRWFLVTLAKGFLSTITLLNQDLISSQAQPPGVLTPREFDRITTIVVRGAEKRRKVYRQQRSIYCLFTRILSFLIPHQHQQDGDKYYVYLLHVAYASGKLSDVWRRYSEFDALRETLSGLLQSHDILPHLTKKIYFARSSIEKV